MQRITNTAGLTACLSALLSIAVFGATLSGCKKKNRPGHIDTSASADGCVHDSRDRLHDRRSQYPA